MSDGPGSDFTGRRDHDREKAQRSHATLRARLARELDPDRTLTRQRRAELVDAEISRRTRAAADRWSQVAAERRARRAEAAAGRAEIAADTGCRDLHARVRALLETSAARQALAARDIAAVYRMLNDGGVAQREIAQLTGQAQSEVSEILAGRTVISYDVLVRICEGLGIPRGWMGLTYTDAHGTEVAYRGEGDVGGDGGVSDEDEAVKRANLLKQGGLMLLGAAVFGMPEPIVLRHPATPLPSRLTLADVEQLSAVTAKLRTLARTYGGQAEAATTAAVRAMRLLAVPAAEGVQPAYRSAVSELLTLAGWTCVDSGRYGQARDHFASAMIVAADAGDAVGFASALRHAGIAMLDVGAFDDALKAYQLGLIRLDGMEGSRARELRAVLRVDSALALAYLDRVDEARIEIDRERGRWDPPDRFAAAEMDLTCSLVALRSGRLDAAEPFAAVSVRTWNAGDRRDGVEAEITLARIHLQAGDPAGAALSQRAIEGVTQTRSARVQTVCLAPLGADLAARPDSTCQDLAERVRQIMRAA